MADAEEANKLEDNKISTADINPDIGLEWITTGKVIVLPNLNSWKSPSKKGKVGPRYAKWMLAYLQMVAISSN